jgi:hypothetical protein
MQISFEMHEVKSEPILAQFWTQGKDKVVPVLNSLSTTPWKHMGEWRYSSISLQLGNRWWWVVSFTPQLLYSRGKQPPVPIVQEAG